MAKNGIEPIGSMGNDTPLAVLSDRPQLLFNYFKQLFAQVTNPPIDAIREEMVTSTEVMIGSEQNLLEPRPENCRQIKLKTPILTNEELEKLRHLNRLYFRTATLPILFNPAEDGAGDGTGAGRALRARRPDHRQRRGQYHHPLGPRHRSGARPDPGAAGGRRACTTT